MVVRWFHSDSLKAKKVPDVLRCRGRFRTEIRLFCVLAVTVFVPYLSPADSKDVHQTTLAILQMNFESKPEAAQKKLLREMALVGTDHAVDFFLRISLSSNFAEGTRREALKGLIAVDSKKYSIVLECLQSLELDDVCTLQNLQLVQGLVLLKPLLASISFKEPTRLLDMKIFAILQDWDESTVQAFDFQYWPKKEASENLRRLIRTTPNTEQRDRLTTLWKKIR